MEEEPVLSDVLETVTEKVFPTSELPLEEYSNMAESSKSESNNIAAGISAFLDAPEENETECNEEENVEDIIEEDKTVSSSTKDIKAEYTPASIVDTILAKAKSENTAITSKNKDIIPGLVSIEYIEVGMIEDTEATTQVKTIESNKDIEATALNTTIENTKEESNLDLIDSTKAPAHTIQIGNGERTTESAQTAIENTEEETKLSITSYSETEQTASTEDKKAETLDSILETDAIERSADIEVACSVSCEASVAADQTSSIGEIEATSTSVLVESAAKVEHVEIMKPEEYSKTEETVEKEHIAHKDEKFESQQLLEANNFMNDIKKEFTDVFASSDNVREDCAPAADITPTNCTADDTTATNCAANDITPTNCTENCTASDDINLTNCTEDCTAADDITPTNYTADDTTPTKCTAEDITPTNCTDSADKPLSTVSDLPLAEIAVATLVLFLALILSYN
jgi:hypothetical protein